MALVLFTGGLTAWRPWEQCGDGLRSIGSPHICVGLDLESGPLRDEDPLADLETRIARYNARAAGDFRTIVLLENLTPNPDIDSTPTQFIRHEISGAIAAVWPDGEPNNFKLMLANIGGNAEHWNTTVDAIIAAASEQRIVAVTGVGLSSTNTRAAVSKLSRNGIATIGGTVTADNMNVDPDNHPIRNFFRVGPTNTDEANAAANYIVAHRFQRVMLIHDTNQGNTYATTLTDAFRKRTDVSVESTKPFDSPDDQPAGTTRDTLLRKLFAGMHSDICSLRPDLIYFTGRGVDLRSLVTSLSSNGACRQLTSITVMTGDDAANIIGEPLPLAGDIPVTVLYTGLAYPNQWQMYPTDKSFPAHEGNYQAFVRKYVRKNNFAENELMDGAAIITYDAVETAATAASQDPSVDPKSAANFIRNIGCNSPVPGASGFIAFDQTTGNQVNKAIPILKMTSVGAVNQVDLVWARGERSCS